MSTDKRDGLQFKNHQKPSYDKISYPRHGGTFLQSQYFSEAKVGVLLGASPGYTISFCTQTPPPKVKKTKTKLQYQNKKTKTNKPTDLRMWRPEGSKFKIIHSSMADTSLALDQ